MKKKIRRERILEESKLRKKADSKNKAVSTVKKNTNKPKANKPRTKKKKEE